MAIVLASKPGLSSTTTLHIPKDWDPTWFRNFISNQLKGADVRNSISGPGISVTGNISSPYATISVGGTGPVVIQGSATATAPTVTIFTNNNSQPALDLQQAATNTQGALVFSLTTSGDAITGGIGLGGTVTGSTTTDLQLYGASGVVIGNPGGTSVNSRFITGVQIGVAATVNGGWLLEGYNSTITTRTGYLDFISGTGGGGGATEVALNLDGTTVNDWLSLMTGGSRSMRVDGTGAVFLLRVATTTTAPGAGGAGALPATPAGYFTIGIGTTAHKVPYY